MTALDVKDLVGAPYELGGRGAPGWCCLGVALEVLRRLGVSPVDPWQEFESAWSAGWRPGDPEEFPTGWRRLGRAVPRHELEVGDLVAARGTHGGLVGMLVHVGGGMALTSLPAAGVVQRRLGATVEAWRWDP